VRRAAVILGVVLGLVGVGAAALARTPTALASDTRDTSVAATWNELTSTPCQFHGLEVHFTFQYHGRVERWQAGPTRFGPGAFSAISGWAEEQFPWVSEEFANPAVRLFLRLGSEPERTLQGAHPHQRFAVHGIVRDAWRNRPWIELTSAIPLQEEIGEATVFHAGRALERMEEGSFEIADESLQQALAAPMPALAREELGRLRQVCAEGMAEPQPTPIRPRK
jgi:hypothetical protein